jgi:O-antigen ligase
LLVLTLPIFPDFYPFLILLLGLNWTIGTSRKQVNLTWKSIRNFLPAIIFFIWYSIALFWSQNLASGLFEITTKLSFLLIPIFFTGFSLEHKQLKLILKSFVLGCFLASLFLLGNALFEFIDMKNRIRAGENIHDFGINVFFKDRLSIFIHPSYMAMYLSFGIWILYLNWKNSFLPVVFRFLSMILFTGMDLLLVSKLGILSILLISIFAFYELAFVQREILKACYLAVLLMAIFLLVITSVPQVSARFEDAVFSLRNSDNVKKADESTAARMSIWNVSAELISQNVWIGTGTGSTNDQLWSAYDKQGLTLAYEQKLNAHNQFIQTFLTVGLPGFLILLWMLFYPLIRAFFKHNRLVSGFFILIILNVMVESMFETQAGIFFFTTFYVLMMDKLSKNHQTCNTPLISDQ